VVEYEKKGREKTIIDRERKIDKEREKRPHIDLPTPLRPNI
jgi:hypothetical protein